MPAQLRVVRVIANLNKMYNCLPVPTEDTVSGGFQRFSHLILNEFCKIYIVKKLSTDFRCFHFQIWD